jgi:hypothetical protein
LERFAARSIQARHATPRDLTRRSRNSRDSGFVLRPCGDVGVAPILAVPGRCDVPRKQSFALGEAPGADWRGQKSGPSSRVPVRQRWPVQRRVARQTASTRQALRLRYERERHGWVTHRPSAPVNLLSTPLVRRRAIFFDQSTVDLRWAGRLSNRRKRFDVDQCRRHGSD